MPSPLPRFFFSPTSTSSFPSLYISICHLSAPLARVSSEKTVSTTTTAMADSHREPRAKESQDKTPQPPLPGISELIMPHLLNIYGSCATARDFEIYAPHATFEDPLMRAHGVKQIKSAFYTLPKVFGESRIVEYTIQENVIGPGKVEILIDNKQHYKFLGKPVDLTTLIRLNAEEGKIVKHEDWWDKKPLKNRDTVKFPLVGRLAEVTRRGSMLLTHAMMGFGKDPRS